MSAGRRRGGAAWLTALLVASACAGDPAPTWRYFRLELPPATGSRDAALLPGTLVVERPRTEAALNERALVYRTEGNAVELHRYAYTRWTDPPPQAVQQALVERLRAQRVADAVVRAGAGASGDWLLRARLLRFERVAGDDPRVEVVLDLDWLRTADRALVHAGSYRVTRETTSQRVEDVVTAIGSALAEVIDRAIEDLARGRRSRP